MIVLLVESPWLVLNTPFLLITNHGELKTSRYRKRGFNTGYSPFSSHFGWTKPVVSPTMSPHFSPINGRNRGRPSPKKGTDLFPRVVPCRDARNASRLSFRVSRDLQRRSVFFWKRQLCRKQLTFLKDNFQLIYDAPGNRTVQVQSCISTLNGWLNYKNSPTWNKANLLDHFNSCYVALWVIISQAKFGQS